MLATDQAVEHIVHSLPHPVLSMLGEVQHAFKGFQSPADLSALKVADWGFDILSLPSAFRIGDEVNMLREVLNDVLLQERGWAIISLVLASALAAACTVFRGDATVAVRQRYEGPFQIARERDDGLLFRTELTKEEQELFDRGGRIFWDASYAALSSTSSKTAIEGTRRQGRRRVRDPQAERLRVRLWAELVVCILLDAAGDASLFYPFNGEVRTALSARVTTSC